MFEQKNNIFDAEPEYISELYSFIQTWMNQIEANHSLELKTYKNINALYIHFILYMWYAVKRKKKQVWFRNINIPS